MTITIEKTGRRYYLIGNTFAIKNQLRDAGCKWDAERRAWWTSNAEIAAQFSGEVKPKEKSEDELRDERAKRPCTGKADYKGRSYYIIGHSRDGQKFCLTTLDCSIEFWAEREACNVTKTYHARTEGRGRWEREVHQTVGGIRRFIEQSKREEKQLAKGEIPEGYCVDLEDGAVKRRSECDMPSN